MLGRHEPLSAADAVWLRMDTPANRMIITALLTFESRLDPIAFESTLQRLVDLPRFKERVVSPRNPFGLPEWEDDPRFDLRAHVHHLALPAPGGEAELRQFVSERMSADLDREKPLWEVDVVERPGGSAVLLRVHHCIVDANALVRVLLDLAEDPAARPAEIGLLPEAPRSPWEWARRQLARGRTFAGLVALPSDPPTSLRRPLGLVKRVAWSRPIAFTRVHRLAREHRASMNDVVMTALAGSLRRWLDQTGSFPAREIRAVVPVFLRGGEPSTRNRFGLALVELPIDEPDRDDRIHKVKRRMDALKCSAAVPVAFDVLRTFAVAGPSLEQLGVELFTRKASLTVTNVPGPRSPVDLAGGRLASLMVWAPTSGRLGLSVTVLSYAGEIRISVAADCSLPLEPEALIEDIEREIEDGAAAARALSRERAGTRDSGSRRSMDTPPSPGSA
jgi:diacylglycerol O-acyltransferase / wax synthase